MAYTSLLLPDCLTLASPLTAVGAEMKLATAVAVDRRVWLISGEGHRDHPQVRAEQARQTAAWEQELGIQPQVIVCDLHPGYVSSQYAHHRAQAENLTLIGVQHHHAHVAACLAEHNWAGPAVGLAFDGTGYGTDGRIWGGEVLLADYQQCQRLYHLQSLPLPGGDAAVKRPYRIAIAYLHTLLPHRATPSLFPHIASQEITFIETMVRQQINSPLTSSMGRLFDAVSALLGLCAVADHEAQAAIALENAARASQVNGRYDILIDGEEIGLAPLFSQILRDLRKAIPIPDIARRFHATIAHLAWYTAAAAQAAHATATPLPIVLSGGVWQNQLLQEMTIPLLHRAGFIVLQHQQVPTHDGGVAYGQTAVAAAHLKEVSGVAASIDLVNVLPLI